jgi:transcriptional regulator with XRE-family HTH domain
VTLHGVRVADEQRKRVRAERERRYPSIRKAAAAGGISNTQWGRYESGEIHLTQPLRVAIAQAFGWPEDWPEAPTQPGTSNGTHTSSTPPLQDTIDQLLVVVPQLLLEVSALRDEVAGLREALHASASAAPPAQQQHRRVRPS